MFRIFKNILHYLELTVVDIDGKFVSGLAVTYEVRKCVDNTLVASGAMAEVSSVYTVSISIADVGEYRVKYFTPPTYEDGFENLLVDDYDSYKANVSGLATPASILVNPANKLDGSLLDASVTSRAAPGDILVNTANKIDGLKIDETISSRAASAGIMGTDAIYNGMVLISSGVITLTNNVHPAMG